MWVGGVDTHTLATFDFFPFRLVLGGVFFFFSNILEALFFFKPLGPCPVKRLDALDLAQSWSICKRVHRNMAMYPLQWLPCF